MGERADELLQAAVTYNCRPSEYLHLEDEFTAYCVDQAIILHKQYIAMKRPRRAGKTTDNAATIAAIMGSK